MRFGENDINNYSNKIKIQLQDESEFFSVLANSTRRDILHLLNTRDFKVSDLAKKLENTIQANQKHLERLEQTGLISKSYGNVAITPLGRMVLEQIPSFFFLAKNKMYFQNHSTKGLPEKFVHRIGELHGSEFIPEPIQSWQKAKNIVEQADEFFFGMSSMVPAEFFDIIKEKIGKNFSVKLILPQTLMVAKGFDKKRKTSGWLEAVSKKKAEERYVSEIPMTVVVTEKSAHLVFANNELGRIDGNQMFYSEYQSFRRWCMDVFDYYWNEVPKVNKLKIEEV